MALEVGVNDWHRVTSQAERDFVRTVILCDLVPSRLILVKVVLAIEAAHRLDLAIQGQRSPQRWEESGCLEFLHCISFSPDSLSPSPARSLSDSPSRLFQYAPAGSPEKRGRTRPHWNSEYR